MFKPIFTIFFVYILSANAYANIEVSFKDGAPKDKFELKNTSQCNVQSIELTIDLSKSLGRLIFDTTASGKGVEVFQPFEVVIGQIKQNKDSQVSDGGEKLSLEIKEIEPNGFASFTIDVDDTLTTSELGNIRVTDNEIAGALVMIDIKGKGTVTATFDENGKALLIMPKCTP